MGEKKHVLGGASLRNHLVVGMLAHVDAGKTTLSEGLLFAGGMLRQLGRVDHQNAFLDTDAMERRRGITIFAKEAQLPLDSVSLTLLDTPGHADFSAEMERTLQVLDYGVLVVSGSEGIQGHTLTLWKLLARYEIPTFLFINKMDLPDTDAEVILSQLKKRLHGGCVSFARRADTQAFREEVAVCDEGVLGEYLESGTLPDEAIVSLIRKRKLFPCYFGSALKLEGVEELLRGLERYTRPPAYPEAFGARVYKISRDAQNNRLTHLKVTGGALPVRTALFGSSSRLGEEMTWTEKVNQIRIYSGERFQTVETAVPGMICAVTGLSQTYPGQGLGAEADALPPMLEPVLSYRILLPEGADPHTALSQLRLLEEEDPLLAVTWREQAQEIHLQLMGEVQTEVLIQRIWDRFGLAVSFDAGSVLYRETIRAPVVGMGHFEPLRHYAEVHLLLEPGERGSGLRFGTVCSEDSLHRSWQRLILSHLEGAEHPGVLTGAPITDLSVTLVAGKAHNQHTDGGDFRQAAYRALRQGLMQAETILLEPWCQFQLELPAEAVGRAMTDLQRVTEDHSLSESDGERALMTGSAPMSFMRSYAAEVTAYTRGTGRLSVFFSGFAPCPDQAAAAGAMGYDPQRDLEHPADSIFLRHGAAYSVSWDQVKEHMHLDAGVYLAREPEPEHQSLPTVPRREKERSAQQLDDELMAIYERTYGPVKPRDFQPASPESKRPVSVPETGPAPPSYEKPDYLLVDGYNIIHAWEDLQGIARQNLDAARQMLMDMLSNYRGVHDREIILVFDAYRVPGGTERVSRYHNISVVYTKEAETADTYIERVTYKIGKRHRVTVASADGAVQMIIWGHGALRISPLALRAELEQASADMTAYFRSGSRTPFSPSVIQAD